MPFRTSGKACTNCGDTFLGSGDLCPDCLPADLIDTATHHRPTTPTGPMCPWCKATINWDTIRRYSREVGPATVECVYYCPSCRAFLEVAAWTDEAGR